MSGILYIWSVLFEQKMEPKNSTGYLVALKSWTFEMGVIDSFQNWRLKSHFIWTQAEFYHISCEKSAWEMFLLQSWIKKRHEMHPLALKVIETPSLRALHVKELPVVSEDFFKYLQGGAGDRGVQAMGEWCFDCIWSSISSNFI